MNNQAIIIQQMQNQAAAWRQAGDRRFIFLDCYRRMTGNMLTAVAAHEFHDAAWVDRLLHRFADYYFDALALYEQDAAAAPPVWRTAFDAAHRPETMVLQNLLLGVNAHINYDLVLALVDVLQDDWPNLTPPQRQQRYADHYTVNVVIGRTIDEVQDEVLEREQPALDLLDKLMGRADEWLISRLITHWRGEVWQHAVCALESADDDACAAVYRQVAEATQTRSEAILGQNGLFSLWRAV